MNINKKIFTTKSPVAVANNKQQHSLDFSIPSRAYTFAQFKFEENKNNVFYS